MEKPKIIIDAHIPYIKGALEPYSEVCYIKGSDIAPADVKDASGLITRTRTKCNAQLLKNSSIKFIASATIGYDHIDTQYCSDNGIKWTNAPGCNSGSVMQYIAAALMVIVKEEDKHPSKLTLGVVGVGYVGKKVAKLAKTLGFKVLLNDPPRARKEGDDKFVSLNRIARKCDILSFHVPLNKEGQDKTLHLFNEKFAKKLEKQPYIINSSRGEITDTQALKSGIREKRLRGVVLDVWENEPNIDEELLDLVMIATPHIAGYSADGKAMGSKMSAEAMSRHLGLGLQEWNSKDVPMPEETIIKINCSGNALIKILRKAILFTYDIKQESKHFKKHYKEFESLRNDYPLRREFGVYKVLLKNCDTDAQKILSKLGFQVEKY